MSQLAKEAGAPHQCDVNRKNNFHAYCILPYYTRIIENNLISGHTLGKFLSNSTGPVSNVNSQTNVLQSE